MLKNPRIRRASAVTMVVLGAILMFFAPEAWPGAPVLILGVVLELVGIALEHKTKLNYLSFAPLNFLVLTI
jgi:hypothetical protein